MITGGILDSKERGKIGLLKMPADMVKCLCDEAHKEGLRVAAHVEGSEGVKIAIENGVDTIEHGAPVDDSTLLMLKKENKAYVATFSPAIPLSFLDPISLGYSADVSYNSKVLLDGMVELTNKCLANKIIVGLGTDTGCPLVTHYDMWRELCYFKKYANVTNKYAIHTATLINAKIAGVSKETGSISIGKKC
ncbi:MAG: amidohydrolase family protein [Clostridium sp.]|nr:MAG: amidohydrolase family protein [Clostridium sp.]